MNATLPVRTVASTPFADQRPGTSGLRKKVPVFQKPHYAENYIQALLNLEGGVAGETLIIGGDGRFYNDAVIQITLKMAIAAGAARLIVGQNGVFSTPAASYLIRLHQAKGGIVLSASHNPAGPHGDFGVKYNARNGGPAPDRMVEDIYTAAQAITSYTIADIPDIDLTSMRSYTIGKTVIDVIDPVKDYADYMGTLFDFNAIRTMFEGGFRMVVDSMNAVTGPYAIELFERRLGAPQGTVINAKPLDDFGGLHPEPGPRYSKNLFDIMFAPNAPDMAAAADGDGDRSLILAPAQFVAPADTLALLAANATLVPGYKKGLKGVARTLSTSRAADRVAKKLGVPLHETGAGYKFFGTLLDAGLTTLCGEENGGLGSDHMREKDALWVVLFWLNILAARRASIKELLNQHWAEFGRDYFCRHDYEVEDGAALQAAFERMRTRIPTLKGKSYAGLSVTEAGEFNYTDPVDGWVSTNLGLCVFFSDGSKSIIRMAGTTSSGATMRVYYENHVSDAQALHQDPQDALKPVITAMRQLIGTHEVPQIMTPTGISL